MEEKRKKRKKGDPAPDPSPQKGGEHKKPWQETYATPEEIREFLSENVLLRYNVITGRPEFRVPERDPMAPISSVFYPSGASPLDEWRSATDWQTVSDRFVDSLWGTLSNWKQVRENDIWKVIRSDYVPLFNPFTRYLDGLPPWDGQGNPILDLATTVTVKGGSEEQLLFYIWLRKWLVGMVAGWINDAVVNEVILVLVGRQGIYKTTWFNALLPPELHPYFHSNTSFGEMRKEEVLKLSEYGLICCEELDTMKDSEMNRLKWAVTTRETAERRAYAHFAERRKHIASYCGTGNNLQFINDTTGTRRWLPFEVESILSPRDYPFDHRAIFAQAYALYRQGFRYWFDDGPETDLQARHNERFEVAQYERDLILSHYRLPREGEHGEFVTSAEIMQTIGGNLLPRLTDNKLGRMMTKLKFRKGRSGNLRGFCVVPYDSNEIRNNRKIRALNAVEDTCSVTLEEIYAVYGGSASDATNATLF
ncbi:MAG: hypothetical protein IJ841_07280 [Prevotella sp.]|nr:hypothetical protein [Prevotella sp.]